MKKPLMLGVVLSISLFLSVAVRAGSVLDETEATTISKTETNDSSATSEASGLAKPVAPYRDRLTTDNQDMGARWSFSDRVSNTEFMAFTSSFSANNAVTLMGGNNASLSFARFGRVPFYQILALTNDVNANSVTKSRNGAVASLPEPATLTLLGAGLATLAAGLRKKKIRKAQK